MRSPSIHAVNKLPSEEPKRHFQVPPCAVIADCPLPTDIILRSSDGVDYGAHSTNLETFSGGFPPAALTKVTGEIVEMPESSAVLRLLLHYMHNDRQPDSSKITFDVLYPLAEAVEKYMVFSAMEVCKIRMQEAIPQHPVKVLFYSIKHDYPELAKIALPLTVPTPFKEINEVMKDRPDIVLKWVEYREPWFGLLKFIYESPPKGSQHKGGALECDLWAVFHRESIQEVAGDVKMAQIFSSILQRNMHYLQDCFYCKSRAAGWARAINTRMSALADVSKVAWLRG